MEKIVAAGGLVINKEKELLMIFRRGKWDLPKGKLDEGERVEDCAVREVKEETGLKKLRIKKFLGVTYHEYFDPYLNTEVIKETYWFEMRSGRKQKLIPAYDEDIQNAEWIAEKNLPEKLTNTYPNIVEIIGKLKRIR